MPSDKGLDPGVLSLLFLALEPVLWDPKGRSKLPGGKEKERNPYDQRKDPRARIVPPHL